MIVNFINSRNNRAGHDLLLGFNREVFSVPWRIKENAPISRKGRLYWERVTSTLPCMHYIYWTVKFFRLLNHKMTNDVTAGYIITDVERLRIPMQKITDYITAQFGVKQSALILPLQRHA